MAYIVFFTMYDYTNWLFYFAQKIELKLNWIEYCIIKFMSIDTERSMLSDVPKLLSENLICCHYL